MLRFNPVMAAEYQAMTQASDAVKTRPPPARQASTAAAAARARRAKARVACAASLLRWIYAMVVHDTSWDAAAAAGGAPASTPPATRSRLPDQRRARIQTAPETFLPDEGESEPVPASGITPCDTLGSSPPVAWSFSPARLNAVGAGLPALAAGRPSPLALRRARRPR